MFSHTDSKEMEEADTRRISRKEFHSGLIVDPNYLPANVTVTYLKGNTLSPSTSLVPSDSGSPSVASNAEEDVIIEINSSDSHTTSATQTGHYAFIRYATGSLMPGAFIGEVFCADFFGTYTAVGATYVLQLTGLNIPDLPKNYGDPSDPKNLLKFGYPLVEVLRFTSIWGELLNGITQFEVKSAIKAVDDYVFDALHPTGGFKNALRASLSHTFASKRNVAVATYKSLSYTFFLVGSAAGAYADLEQIKEPAQNWLTVIGGNAVLNYLGASAMLYCVLAFGPKTQKGIDFWLKPSTLKKRHENHGNLAIEAQVAMEMTCVTLIRAFSLSFTFGRLGEQWQISPPTFYALGALGGFAQGAQIFAPFTMNNYHRRVDVENGETAVNQEERNQAYAMKYANMGYLRRAVTELRRPFFIGIAQSAFFGAYGVGYKLAPLLSTLLIEKGCPEEAALALQIALSATTMALTYYPFYKANMYKELNELAYENRSKSETEEPVSGFVASSAAKNNSDDQKIETESGIDFEDESDDDEEEEVTRPNRCATFFGAASSFAMVSTRLFSAVASLINNSQIGDKLSRADWSAIALFTGTVVGDNRYLAMTKNSIDTLAALGCRYKEKVSKNGFFGRNHPDTLRQRRIESVAIEPQPLLTDGLAYNS